MGTSEKLKESERETKLLGGLMLFGSWERESEIGPLILLLLAVCFFRLSATTASPEHAIISLGETTSTPNVFRLILELNDSVIDS